jgi:glycosyltransferase involved in cell wall biosynthesis
MKPTATAVIPCFNHGRFVRAAVESCLGQLDADVEVVIIDDGSDDGATPAACDELAGERVRVIHQENLGLPAARNRGAKEARSEFVFFLDADDFIAPTFVSKLAAAVRESLSRGEKVSHAYCQETLTELGTGTWRVPEWDPLMLLITNLHPVTALVRRDVFEELGGFDESMRLGYEDWSFWITCSERGYRGARVPEPLFFWRRHSQITMVMEAVKRHDELFAAIVARHRDTYARHAMEIVSKSNSMLRAFDCNWIDETGYPIPLQFLWSLRDGIVDAQHNLWKDPDRTYRLPPLAEPRVAAAVIAAVEAQREFYESFAAVRIHRRLHRVLRAMPKPISHAITRVFNAIARLTGKKPSGTNPITRKIDENVAAGHAEGLRT